jgi:hypothetical protein
MKAIQFAGRLRPLWLQSPVGSRTRPRVCPSYRERTQVARHLVEAAIHPGCDIGSEAGLNDLEVEITNLWPNRIIGDLQPDAKDKYTFYRLRRVQGRLSLAGVGSARAGQAVAPTADEAIGLNLFPENYSTLLAVNVKSPRIVPC